MKLKPARFLTLVSSVLFISILAIHVLANFRFDYISMIRAREYTLQTHRFSLVFSISSEWGGYSDHGIFDGEWEDLVENSSTIKFSHGLREVAPFGSSIGSEIWFDYHKPSVGSMWGGNYMFSSWYSDVNIPYWSLLLLTGILPCYWFIKRVRRPRAYVAFEVVTDKK